MDNNEIKITTGEGSGLPTGQGVPPVPANLPMGGAGQPDFLAPENMGPSPIPEGVEKHGGKLRTVLMALIGLIFVGGVGALGYFVIYPALFPAKLPVVNLPPAVTLAPHTSLLTKATSASVEIKLNDLGYSTIASALQNEAYNQLADGQYKEVKISDSQGQVAFGKYLGGLSQAVAGAGVWFEDDFTALFYYDAAGVWPLYIAKLKPGVTVGAIMSGLKTAENSLDLGNFFVSSPGKFTVFKDGKLGNYATRYNVASQAGAAFNYGVMGNYFVISTSYIGLKNSLPLLGL